MPCCRQTIRLYYTHRHRNATPFGYRVSEHCYRDSWCSWLFHGCYFPCWAVGCDADLVGLVQSVFFCVYIPCIWLGDFLHRKKQEIAMEYTLCFVCLKLGVMWLLAPFRSLLDIGIAELCAMPSVAYSGSWVISVNIYGFSIKFDVVLHIAKTNSFIALKRLCLVAKGLFFVFPRHYWFFKVSWLVIFVLSLKHFKWIHNILNYLFFSLLNNEMYLCLTHFESVVYFCTSHKGYLSRQLGM